MKNNTLIIIVVIALVIIVGGIFFAIMSNSPHITPTTFSVQQSVQPGYIASTTTITNTTASTTTLPAQAVAPKAKSTPAQNPQAPQTTSHAIVIQNYSFIPQNITIKKGTTITWTNQDLARHTVTGDTSGPSSEFLSKGQSYSYTFNDVGTINYHCEPHPYMKATITVTN